MKKLVRSVLMLSIASIAILSSCSKETDTEVTDVKVTITSSPASVVEIGQPITLTVTATGNPDNKIKSISVTRSGDNKVVLSKKLSETSSTQTVTDTILLVGSYTYTVAVEGDKGSPAIATCSITARAPYGTTSSTPVAIDLKGQTQDSTENYFMKLTPDFTPYDRGRSTFTANKANIDMCFFFGTANKATLASPDDATAMQTVYSYIDWTGAKKTKFSKTSLTLAQFNTIETSGNDSAIVNIAIGTTTWGVSVNNLAKDNVLVYETAEGKKGLVLVADLTGTQASNASISVRVISQD